MKFLADMFKEEEAKVIVFGVDYTKDSKKVLNKLRKASWFIEPFDADECKNPIHSLKIFDRGNVGLNAIAETIEEIREKDKIPLMLSRGHMPTYFAARTFTDAKLVIFDAHCDLQDTYIDELIAFDSIGQKEKFNGSTWLRRLCEQINPERVALLGIRSFSSEELEFMKSHGMLFYTSKEIREKKDELLLVLRQFTKLAKVYLSIDVDVFDPSVAPAVDYPEPSGINLEDFNALVSGINGKIVGMDLCCLAPSKNLITEFLALKALLKVLGKL